MQNFFVKYAGLLLANWQRAMWGCIIVVSAVIVLMGSLKKLFIDKISNKLVRKIVLSFGSVIMSMLGTSIYFLADHINFDHYWLGAGLNAVATIITYWLYENTGCRNFIHFAGTKTLGKLWNAFVNALISGKNGTDKKDVELLQLGLEDIKKEVKPQLITSASEFGSSEFKNL